MDYVNYELEERIQALHFVDQEGAQDLLRQAAKLVTQGEEIEDIVENFLGLGSNYVSEFADNAWEYL